MTSPVPDALTHGPFTLAEAAEVGVSRQVLRGRRFRLMFRGVYVLAALPLTIVVWLRAALLLMPADAVVSHRSAIRLWGFDPGGSDDLELSTNTRAQTVLKGVLLHRRIGRLHAVERSGLPVTGPDRTWVDCATTLGIVQLVQAAEHLLHTRATTYEALLRYCSERHLDGVCRARRVMALVCENVESPMETLVRLMIVFARLPCPEPNVRIVDADGRFVARVDLLCAAFQVVVEYDGWQHERDSHQRQRDRERREELEALGYRLIVITDADLRTPAQVPWRVHAALVARGYSGPSPAMNTMWHRWFPTT